jgi:PhzF family phenazine biosynthesis protein
MARMVLPLFTVDAFSSVPFAGNPAAVCLLDGPRPDGWMQALAREMNLSETAFLLPEGDGWRLRWLTPAVEVALCGHATLASAHVLWSEGHLAPGAVARFHTASGLLTARRLADEPGAAGDRAWIELDFPAVAPICLDPAGDDVPAGLLPALGVATDEVVELGRSKFDYLVVVDRETAVRRLQPDHRALRTLPVRGVAVTAAGDVGGGFDCVSRFFAPGSGVDEDPVTGSAHCTLATYWSERLGRDVLRAYQASARGGELRLAVTRRAGTAVTEHRRETAERVRLAGQAVTVLRATLAV